MLAPPDSGSGRERDRLGVYRIEALLGSGGMGEVFLAWDEILERHVAIKRISSLTPADANRRRRFLREARAVARLDHPAIVRIFHVLERDDGDRLVMEYVKGLDLARMRAGGPIELPRCLQLARGIAEGLAEAHAAGLIHRDLKLANVMVTLGGSVKILDFGLAKAREPESPVPPAELPPASGDLGLTGAGAILGTAYAMSPEQAEGRELDPRSDLFALGSLLYELLTGVRPFQGPSLAETLHRVVAAAPVPIETLLPALPGELAELMSELLARRRERRPPSAQAVADRLTWILDRCVGLPAGLGRPTIGASYGDGEPAAAEDSEATAPRPLAALPAPAVLLRTLASVAPLSGKKDREALRRCAERLLARFDVQEADGPDLDFLFRRPAEAAAFALALQAALAHHSPPLAAGVALHLGEIRVMGAYARVKTADQGELFATARRLARSARPGQTLLSRNVFDLARGARAPAELADEAVRWLAHGSFYLEGSEEATEIFEVGLAGLAPPGGPLEGPELRRATRADEELALGWRPAVGQEVPRRPGWLLSERLGEGGFGEVWLARQAGGEERVFKFCFDEVKLRTLKREATIFRLLRETLGHRADIARLISWDFEEAPYFLESAYSEGGDLPRWAGQRGGLAEIPLATRLELVAQVAEALAAAHSAGVLHQDVKPRNVLVRHDGDGRPQAVLTDFGLSFLTRREALESPGFTVLGFSASTPEPAETTGGTPLYMAPELLAGQPATTAADVYALGVLLYQMVVGDFGRAPAEGWRREIGEELLVADIAACVDGRPEERLRSPAELAERLRGLDQRRLERRREEAAAAAGRRAERRRRVAGWLGVAAAFVLPVLAAFAFATYQAENEERKAREQAERRRQQAEALIDYMLGDLRQQLQPIGKLKILDQVGDRALDYFSKVPAAELSAAEMASHSKALHQIGQVRFGLGRMPEAAEAFQSSLAIAKRLAASDPANLQWQFDLGQTHYWIGFLRWKERQLDLALTELQEYLRISQGLVEREPENRVWQLELAYSHSNIGSILEELDQVAAAAASVERSVAIFDRLSAQRPADFDLLVEAAKASQKLGELAHRSCDLGNALSRHRAAQRQFEIALAAAPDNAERTISVATAKGYVGNVLFEMGDTAPALELYLADLDALRKLAERDRENYTYQEFLSLRLNKVGRAYLALGDRKRARDYFERDRAVAGALIARNPELPGWRLAQARNSCSWALLHLANGSPEAALEAATRASTTLSELLTSREGHWQRWWLAWAHFLRGQAHSGLGQGDRAAADWREGARIASPMVAAAPLPPEIDIQVRLLLSAGRLAEAEPWIARLRAAGYREPAYLAALQKTTR